MRGSWRLESKPVVFLVYLFFKVFCFPSQNLSVGGLWLTSSFTPTVPLNPNLSRHPWNSLNFLNFLISLNLEPNFALRHQVPEF